MLPVQKGFAMMRCRPLQWLTMVLLLGTLPACSSNTGETISLQGSGASFPAPLYQRWFLEYNAKNPNVQINYQAIGSSAGVKAFVEGTVNFAASDAAIKDQDAAKVARGVQLFPLTAGSIVLAYNLPGGPKELKLSREAYIGIFTGKITQWNDPIIAKANEGVKLPDTKIQVVSRADGSGTTYVFSQHLSAISDEWKNGPGTGTSVKWPVGIGAKGNDGVTATIEQTPGAIGYIEYGYAWKKKLAMATLENSAGKFVAPTLEASQAALASGGAFPANNILWIPDPAGETSYPIVTYTWLLAYKKYENPAELKAIQGVLRYALTEGQKFAADEGYIPLPESVTAPLLKNVDQLGS